MKYQVNILFIIIFVSFLLNGCMQKSEDTTTNIVIIEGDSSIQYSSIQDAIANASENNTIIVYPGIYQESIQIKIPINLMSKDKNKTSIEYSDSENQNVITIEADGCKIDGFQIRNKDNQSDKSSFSVGIKVLSSNNQLTNNDISNFSYGIYILEKSENNTVTKNQIESNQNGIELWESIRNHIYSNNISKNTQFGVLTIQSANFNTINSNIFYDNKEAVRIKDASFNTISNNILMNNEYGIRECCGASNNEIFDNSENTR